MSVLLHGALVGALVYGYLQFRRPPPQVTALAIDATVVSQATLDAARRPVADAPAPPASIPPPQVPQTAAPLPDPAAQREAQEAQEAQKAQKAEEAQARAASQREAARKQAADAAERDVAAQKAEADRAAREEVIREKAEREARAKARAAQELAARKAAAQAAASQADLKKSIEAEERLDAARASGAMSSWAAQIQARIQRAWIRPPSARAGIDCTLYVTQVPGGEIVNVRLGTCNGDDAVKQSILDAAYRASPLPAPADPALFERNLEVTFRPID